MQLGFIIPLGAQPEQCHDAITPNDMYSDMTCALSGAFLLFGGFAAIMWGEYIVYDLITAILIFEGFLRSLSIHLQICWQVVTGKKFFWSSLIAGWGLPGLFLAIMLPLTGVSYRFGDTCHINHMKALQDYWGPLLAFAAISTILQFITFGYCIKVYIKSLINDGSANSTTQASSGLPSHSSRSGSVKTVTAGQAYRRVKKVIGLQWRGTAIVLIIIIDVVFLSIVFVQMDNTVTAAMHNLDKAEPWLLCLVFNGGNKTPCLDKVKRAGLVANEDKVMAALVLLSVSGSCPNQQYLQLTLITAKWHMGSTHHRPNLDARRLDRPRPKPLHKANRLCLRRRPQLLQQSQKLRNDNLTAKHLRNAQNARPGRHIPPPRPRRGGTPVATVTIESVHKRLLQQRSRLEEPAAELLPASGSGLQEPQAELFDPAAAERGAVTLEGELREILPTAIWQD